jgi:hypothetical protein
VILAQLASGDTTAEDRVTVEVIRCYLEAAPREQWARWMARAEAVLSDELQLELGVLAQRRQMLPSERLERLRQLARGSPAWSRRAEFSSQAGTGPM